MKPANLGTIYTARAKLYNAYGKRIGDCIDTPNAIAKAMMQDAEIYMAKGLLGMATIHDMTTRMADWNIAVSGLRRI